jgi:hypothetical protein
VTSKERIALWAVGCTALLGLGSLGYLSAKLARRVDALEAQTRELRASATDRSANRDRELAGLRRALRAMSATPRNAPSGATPARAGAGAKGPAAADDAVPAPRQPAARTELERAFVASPAYREAARCLAREAPEADHAVVYFKVDEQGVVKDPIVGPMNNAELRACVTTATRAWRARPTGAFQLGMVRLYPD